MMSLKPLCLFLMIISTTLQNDDFTNINQIYKQTRNLTKELKSKNIFLLKELGACNTNLSNIIMFNNKKRLNSYFDKSLVDDLTIFDEFLPYLTGDFQRKFSELKKSQEKIAFLESQLASLSKDQNAVNTSVVSNKIKRAFDCSFLSSSGIMLIEFEETNIDVYCEHGWLLIQRRSGHETTFNRTWKEYKHGFGDLRGDFWIGNEIIYKLTKRKSYKLSIELTDWSDEHFLAEYDTFQIESEQEAYRLSVSGYKGNASKDYLDDLYAGLMAHNSATFSTYDNYTINKSSAHMESRLNCALKSAGAWWFLNKHGCLPVNLNGLYITGASAPITKGIKWLAMNNHDRNYSLKKSKMKIKPTCC